MVSLTVELKVVYTRTGNYERDGSPSWHGRIVGVPHAGACGSLSKVKQEIGRQVADLKDFLGRGPIHTPGGLFHRKKVKA